MVAAHWPEVNVTTDYYKFEQKLHYYRLPCSCNQTTLSISWQGSLAFPSYLILHSDKHNSYEQSRFRAARIIANSSCLFAVMMSD